MPEEKTPSPPLKEPSEPWMTPELSSQLVSDVYASALEQMANHLTRLAFALEKLARDVGRLAGEFEATSAREHRITVALFVLDIVLSLVIISLIILKR